ncbi:MAG: site-2 protease family protein [Clostridia bacterium]|jgi:Zn-dependent protease|nr:site-2 protease family protein [Clostridia bacterium]
MNSLFTLLLQIPAVIFATTLHEFSRAVVSTILGDKKPKNDGKLTINPVKHFEPIGFILMWLTGFGWGKPVETSPMFYKNRKHGVLITAIMPSVINIVFAAIFGIVFAFVGAKNMSVYIQAGNAASVSQLHLAIYILLYDLIEFNVSIAVYNIVPVSPMDGLKVLSAILPANKYFSYIQYEKIIQVIFLLLLFMNYTNVIFGPIINFIMRLLLI